MVATDDERNRPGTRHFANDFANMLKASLSAQAIYGDITIVHHDQFVEFRNHGVHVLWFAHTVTNVNFRCAQSARTVSRSTKTGTHIKPRTHDCDIDFPGNQVFRRHRDWQVKKGGDAQLGTGVQVTIHVDRTGLTRCIELLRSASLPAVEAARLGIERNGSHIGVGIELHQFGDAHHRVDIRFDLRRRLAVEAIEQKLMSLRKAKHAIAAQEINFFLGKPPNLGCNVVGKIDRLEFVVVLGDCRNAERQ